MKPEYRSLDPVGVSGEIRDSLAALVSASPAPVDRFWTIGELARECDVTLRALRFYEGKGLLAPTRDGSTRLYDRRDVRRLKYVLHLKRIGFSLVEIGALLELLEGAAPGRARLERLLVRVEDQVGVLEDRRRELDGSLAEIGREIAELKRHLSD